MHKAACEKALSLVGQGYIYGAKGQTCSPAFREQQAKQYPEQASKILNEGAKWDGKPVWDCAQLTRAVAKAAGVSLVSGATSQWNKTLWTAKGTIDTLPPGETAFVFRQSDGKMQHTGVALGDGTCVHARGTAYGVIRQNTGEYPWTHWGSPWKEETLENTQKARVWALTGSTVNLRNTPGGGVIARVPIGTDVEVTGTMGGWSIIRCEESEGYMQSTFLKDITAETQLDALLQRINQLEERLAKAGL